MFWTLLCLHVYGLVFLRKTVLLQKSWPRNLKWWRITVILFVTACVLSASGIVTMNLKQCRTITNELPKLKQWLPCSLPCTAMLGFRRIWYLFAHDLLDWRSLFTYIFDRFWEPIEQIYQCDHFISLELWLQRHQFKNKSDSGNIWIYQSHSVSSPY